MKLLGKLMDQAGKHFAPGGRLARWYPLFEAVDSFLLGSAATLAFLPAACRTAGGAPLQTRRLAATALSAEIEIVDDVDRAHRHGGPAAQRALQRGVREGFSVAPAAPGSMNEAPNRSPG